jgi:hypothetical protein
MTFDLFFARSLVIILEYEHILRIIDETTLLTGTHLRLSLIRLYSRRNVL